MGFGSYAARTEHFSAVRADNARFPKKIRTATPERFPRHDDLAPPASPCAPPAAAESGRPAPAARPPTAIVPARHAPPPAVTPRTPLTAMPRPVRSPEPSAGQPTTRGK